MKKMLTVSMIIGFLLLSACQSNEVQSEKETNFKDKVVVIDDKIQKPQQDEVDKLMETYLTLYTTQDDIYDASYEYSRKDCRDCGSYITFEVISKDYESEMDFVNDINILSESQKIEALKSIMTDINDQFVKDLYETTNFDGLVIFSLKAMDNTHLITLATSSLTKKVEIIEVSVGNLESVTYTDDELNNYIPVEQQPEIEYPTNEVTDSDPDNYWETYGFRFWSQSVEFDRTDETMDTFDWEKQMFSIGETAFGADFVIFTYSDGCVIVHNVPEPDYFFVTHEEADQWR